MSLCCELGIKLHLREHDLYVLIVKAVLFPKQLEFRE